MEAVFFFKLKFIVEATDVSLKPKFSERITIRGSRGISTRVSLIECSIISSWTWTSAVLNRWIFRYLDLLRPDHAETPIQNTHTFLSITRNKFAAHVPLRMSTIILLLSSVYFKHIIIWKKIRNLTNAKVDGVAYYLFASSFWHFRGLDRKEDGFRRSSDFIFRERFLYLFLKSHKSGKSFFAKASTGKWCIKTSRVLLDSSGWSPSYIIRRQKFANDVWLDYVFRLLRVQYFLLTMSGSYIVARDRRKTRLRIHGHECVA